MVALILTKALPKMVFSFTIALTLTKALPESVFFAIFVLVLTKAPPQRVFYWLFIFRINMVYLTFCHLAKAYCIFCGTAFQFISFQCVLVGEI